MNKTKKPAEFNPLSRNRIKKAIDLKYPLVRFGVGDLIGLEDGARGEVTKREQGSTTILWTSPIVSETTYKWAENERFWPIFKGEKK